MAAAAYDAAHHHPDAEVRKQKNLRVHAKLLIVDLSGSGTVTRIVSFIGAGVLMLLIGYVAPLPAKEASDAQG